MYTFSFIVFLYEQLHIRVYLFIFLYWHSQCLDITTLAVSCMKHANCFLSNYPIWIPYYYTIILMNKWCGKAMLNQSQYSNLVIPFTWTSGTAVKMQSSHNCPLLYADGFYMRIYGHCLPLCYPRSL